MVNFWLQILLSGRRLFRFPNRNSIQSLNSNQTMNPNSALSASFPISYAVS
jgi:hypothetical protein